MHEVELRYELTDETVWGDRLGTLVFKVDSVSADALDRIAEYLIDNPRIRTSWPIEGVNGSPGRMELEIADASRLSESTFWHIVYDANKNGVDLAKRYVASLIGSIEEGGDLPPCSELEVVGQHPIYAYFDKHWDEFGQRPMQDSCLLDMIDTFLRYLQRCDIDHEVPHRKYVEKVLDHLEWLDSDRFFAFIEFWIDADQRGTENVKFKHIREPGRLKKLVDHLLATHENGWGLKIAILNLCAVAYGSNMALTEDVLNYSRKEADLGDGHTLINFETGLRIARAERDRYFAASPTDFDTGFHRYDRNTGHWTSLLE